MSARDAGPRAYALLDAKARTRGVTLSQVAAVLGWPRSRMARWHKGTSEPLWGAVEHVLAYLDTLPVVDADDVAAMLE